MRSKRCNEKSARKSITEILALFFYPNNTSVTSMTQKPISKA